MKNWSTLEPDRVKLLNKHFTPGRGGKTIDKVVIHHNAGVLSIDQIWQVWQDRAASAHYQITTAGEIGQLVWDKDTAWHAANQTINQTSIGLEFSNSAGAAADWPIADKTIEEGAHLVAAICRYYKLGTPQAGKNVRFHREFTTTSCPHHLAPGGKYHNQLMTRAVYWYNQMSNPVSTTPAPEEKEETMNQEQSAKLNRVHHELTHEFQSRYLDEVGKRSAFKETAIGYALENDAKLTRLTDQVLPRIEAKLDAIIAKLGDGDDE